MKLAAFTFAGRRSIGVVDGDRIADVGAVGGAPQTLRDALSITTDLPGYFGRLLDWAPRLATAQVVFQAPIDDPQHFFAVGLNYRDHAAEMQAPLPNRPRFFNKLISSITGPRSRIIHPGFSDSLDYEGELGVVIGQYCSRVSSAQARDYVAGYIIVNDVSLREWVNPDLLVLAKGCATFAPIGPWITTADEIPDPHNLRIQTRVNGELRQNESTSQMVFDCWTLIEWISKAVELQPGDIITTGSPRGAGAGFSPRRYLHAGDVVTVSIEGLGEITNTVEPELNRD